MRGCGIINMEINVNPKVGRSDTYGALIGNANADTTIMRCVVDGVKINAPTNQSSAECGGLVGNSAYYKYGYNNLIAIENTLVQNIEISGFTKKRALIYGVNNNQLSIDTVVCASNFGCSEYYCAGDYVTINSFLTECDTARSALIYNSLWYAPVSNAFNEGWPYLRVYIGKTTTYYIGRKDQNGLVVSDFYPGSGTIEVPNSVEVSSPSCAKMEFFGISHEAVGYSGYKFDCWVEEEGDGDFYDIAYLAKFRVITYKITYDLDGGTNNSSNPSTYTVEDSFTLLDPTKTGYDFAGWTGSNGTTPQTSVQVSGTGDKEYTANWTIADYTISYNLNGGTVASANPEKYNVTTNDITLNNPTKTGYTFAGWTGGCEGDYVTNSKKVTIEKGSTGDRTYTANWTAVTYSITYILDDGTNNSSNPSTYTVESSFALADPTKTDHTFLGWTGSNGSTPQKGVAIAKGTTGALTFTANWRDLRYSITFKRNTNAYTRYFINGTASTTTTDYVINNVSPNSVLTYWEDETDDFLFCYFYIIADSKEYHVEYKYEKKYVLSSMKYNGTKLTPKDGVKSQYITTQAGNVTVELEFKSYDLEFN